MNNTDPNGMNVFNVKPIEDKQPEVEIIGAEPSFNNRVPDNFNDQKYIINEEAKPTNTYVEQPMAPGTEVLYKNATTGVDFNEEALTTLNVMLEKLKQAPISTRAELYENISLWFENTYVDEDSDEGFKIIDYDTYVEMLKLLVDAENYLQ